MTTEQLMNEQAAEQAQEVIGNVAQAAEHAVETAAHHYGAFYENPQFWVGVSFVLVVLLLAKPIAKLGKELLVKRINAIAQRINEAQRLKDDAQKLWVEYEKKFFGAKAEAEEILKKAEKEIEFVKKQRIAKLEEDIKIREAEAKARIQAAEQEALQEIRNMSSELSVKAAKKAVQNKLDDKAKDQLIDASIELLPKIK